ncbi:MAG: hypothetical protein JSU57_02165 [Candidatus Heimdallarchaeota archaeon]|nr:MAG: hypothetical protein JSU57_02165 [Candidatus Heimdallarchaeota archaeon]
MSEKNIVLSCIWRTDDFIVTDSKIRPSDDEAILVIDENTEKITTQIPRHFSLITKKIIERRVQSIAKSGFTIPETQIRIGMGFEVEITKEEVIPDVLLQEGHKYSLELPMTVTETPSQTIAEKPEPEHLPTFLTQEEDYIPTFLTPEVQKSDITPPVQPEYKAEIYQESVPADTLERIEEISDDTDSIAGRFLIALTKTGDVYISQKNDHYSVEYSAGRVDFLVRNEDIEILATKRIPADDQTLKQAISAATRK